MRKKYTKKHAFYGLNSANPKKHAHFYKKKGVILNLLLSVGAWLRRDVIASYDYPFLLCNQTVGFHPEMGRFWMSKDYPYNDEFSAYMVAKIYRAEGIAS